MKGLESLERFKLRWNVPPHGEPAMVADSSLPTPPRSDGRGEYVRLSDVEALLADRSNLSGADGGASGPENSQVPKAVPLRTEQGEADLVTEVERANDAIAESLDFEREAERLREALEKVAHQAVDAPHAREIARAALSQDTEERCRSCGGRGFSPAGVESESSVTVPCPDCTPTHSPTDAGGER